MEESPGNMSTLSVHLCRVLDEIGLNKFTVKKRRDVHLFLEQELLVSKDMISVRIIPFLFGSQSEGTCTPGLNSDYDCLHCITHFNVIQYLGEWAHSQTNLLMLRENAVPGYCQLHLLNNDKPEPEMTLPSQDFIYDEYNRVVLKNSIIDHFKPDRLCSYRNGPAHSFHLPNILDGDVTFALICTSRLEATEKWAAERKRNSSWPTTRLINQAVNDPFFLVPVGYKLSPTKNIEWRISTSLAERRLMFSLNIVQIKCYVSLKILIKTFVTPEVGKSITSYHCKTALLYCIEGTEADFWREDNLIQCITRCFEMLHAWVTDLFCPHFILAEANLFAGKVTLENRGTLQFILRCLIQNTAYFILAIRMDGLGYMLQMKLGNEPNSSPILDSVASKILLGCLEHNKHMSRDIPFLVHVSSLNISKVIISLRQLKTMFESRTNFSNKLQPESTSRAIKLLSRCLGSLLASSSLGRHNRIPQEANDLLDASATSEISVILKQASILYCSGEVGKVKQLCQNIGGHFEKNITYPVCGCYPGLCKYSPAQFQTMYTRKHEVRYAQCVAFTPHEINCVPQALRYELFRAVGNDIDQRQLLDEWMVLAVVDSLPFLYYLQYMTYREIGECGLRKRALHYLEQYIKRNHKFLSHVETALNILGQCHEMEKQPGAALHCYRTSLDIRPRNNAANWLVPLLLYRYTQGR